MTPSWILIAILDFCGHIKFFNRNSVLSEDKTVWRMQKCFTVDYLEFFKEFVKTTNIQHLGLCRHFGLFSKTNSLMLCLHLKNQRKSRRNFWKMSIFEKFRVKTSFHGLLKYLRHLGFFSKNFNGFELRAQKSIRIDIQMLQKLHRTTKWH